MSTAGAVADCSATLAPRGVGSDQAADEANGLRIASLMELETWCGDDWPDCEYWRCVASAAAVELGGMPEQMTNYLTALAHLRQRRNELMQELRHDPGYAGLKDANDQAQQIIADEINHFLFQQYEETHMPTGTKAKPRKTEAKKPDPIVEMLKKPWHPKSQRPAVPGGEGSADEVSIELIMPSHNPRQVFNQEAIEQLAESIKANGILQALLVAPPGLEGRYELIAGERRLRAAKLAGLTTVPVRIVEKTDQEMATARLAENLLREDLNPIEEALGYQDMLDRFAGEGLTQKALGEQLGRSQAHISNRLRLLKAPKKWQERLIAGEATDHHLWELIPFAERPTVLEAIEKRLKREYSGKVPEAKRFRWVVESAVRDASRPLKSHWYTSPEGKNWGSLELKPTPAQVEELDVFEVKFEHGYKERHCWNIACWEKLVTAQQQRKREREAAAAEKAEKKGGKVSAAEQRKKDEKAQAVYAKKLFRYKVAWLQKALMARIGDREQRPAFFTLVGWATLFATTAEGVTGRRLVLEERLALDNDIIDPTKMVRAIATVDPQDLLSDLLRQWVSQSFEGYHADIRPGTILALADQAGIDIKREWELDREFLEIHTRAQLDEIASEWGDGCLPAKRAEAIDDLMGWKGKAKTPQRLVDCEAVSLI